MANELLTAGKIATELKVPGAQVKRAIAELKLKPTATKGPCNYYSPEQMKKIRAALS